MKELPISKRYTLENYDNIWKELEKACKGDKDTEIADWLTEVNGVDILLLVEMKNLGEDYYDIQLLDHILKEFNNLIKYDTKYYNSKIINNASYLVTDINFERNKEDTIFIYNNKINNKDRIDNGIHGTIEIDLKNYIITYNKLDIKKFNEFKKKYCEFGQLPYYDNKEQKEEDYYITTYKYNIELENNHINNRTAKIFIEWFEDLIN